MSVEGNALDCVYCSKYSATRVAEHTRFTSLVLRLKHELQIFSVSAFKGGEGRKRTSNSNQKFFRARALNTGKGSGAAALLWAASNQETRAGNDVGSSLASQDVSLIRGVQTKHNQTERGCWGGAGASLPLRKQQGSSKCR